MDRVVVSEDKCFTVRYTTKPESIGNVSYELEHEGSGYILRNGANELRGTSQPAKDVEAVLVWDAKQQAYVMHQVSENMRVSKKAPEAQKQHRQQPTNPVFRSRVATPQVLHTPPAFESERESREVSEREVSPESAAPSQPAEPSGPPEDSEDDFGDLATELAGELRKAESEEEESEEE